MAKREFTYDDLLGFPDDKLKREIIGGELFVTPPPALRHEKAVVALVGPLWAYSQDHGGQVLASRCGVYFSETHFVEPDVVFLTADHVGRIMEPYLRAAPDLVVEVSSPTTRRQDILTKRGLYEEHGVPEYWFVDLEADRIEVYRHDGTGYPAPEIFGRGTTLTPELLPGFELAVDDALAVE